MPRLPHALTLAAALALVAPACKKTPGGASAKSTSSPVRKGRDDAARLAAGPRLPEPHRLAQEPDAGAYVAKPAALLASLDAYVPQAPALASLAEFVIGTQAPAELAGTLARHVAGERAWAAVHVAGEDIVSLPVRPDPEIAAALRRFPARGDFGAVELPAPALDLPGADGSSAGPRLAWFDAQTNHLVFAVSERGLATSRQLDETYGARPVWGTLAAARGATLVPGFPYARVTASGEGLHKLDVATIARRGEPLPTPREIAPGALTGMLSDAGIAVGASTRWPGYKRAVGEIIREMNSSVDRAGFAAKMMLDPMVDQAAKVLRRWNGRVMVGVGPARHVRIGLGADDVGAAHRELLALLRMVLDNLQLARMFAEVPGASLRKTQDQPLINVLTLDGLSRYVPAAGKSLLDDKGRLRIAIAASDHAGGVLVVVGPDPDPVLSRWVAQLGGGPAAQASADDLLAGTLAVSAEHLEPLMRQPASSAALLSAVLGLSADRDPTRVVVEQKPDRYAATVRGPELQAPRRAPRPAGGKPAR